MNELTGSPTTDAGLGVGAAVIVGLIIKAWPEVREFFKNRAEQKRLNDKSDSDLKISEAQGITLLYRGLFDEMKSQMATLIENLRKQDEDHASCRAERAVQKERIIHLEMEVHDLKSTIHNLELRISAPEHKA
jgi:DNA-directed RNA polymerase specialized sigma subunit